MSYLSFCLLFTLLTPALSTISVTILSDSPAQVKVGQSVTLEAKIENLPTETEGYIIGWGLGPQFLGVVGRDLEILKDRFPRDIIVSEGLVSLTITNAEYDFNGNVSLVIQKVREFNMLEHFPLQVLVPPTSVKMLLNGGAALEEKKEYNISCVAHQSNPAVDIKWFHNGAQVGTEVFKVTKSNGYSNSHSYLPIVPTWENSGDEWKCVVSGSSMESSVTKQLTLDVWYVPKVTIVTSGDSYYQIAGNAVTFSCSAISNPIDVTWQWFIGEEELSGATSSSYTYESIDAELNGKELHCQATNRQGSTKETLKLVVYYPPEFTETPTNVQADIGDNVSLQCKAEGNPPPVITWSKMMQDLSYRIIGNEGAFVKPSLLGKDFGKYRCSAAVGEEYFKTLEMEFHLLKKDVPRIITSEDSMASYSQGQDAILTCEAISIPHPLEILWFKGNDNEPIDFSNSRYSTVTKIELDVVTNILSIKDLASTDFDIYNCTFINERGIDSSVFTLEQKNDFPWKWALAIAAGVIVLILFIAITVCICRRKKTKTSSAGSLSVVSNTTDNSIKKPAEGIEHVESSSLPEYGMRPIDVWRNNEEPNDSHVFDTADYSHEPKPELYGSYAAPNNFTTFGTMNAYPLGNYGSYRVQHPTITAAPVPPYSTLPLRPARMLPDSYNRAPHVGNDEAFPPPPTGNAEFRLATNV